MHLLLKPLAERWVEGLKNLFALPDLDFGLIFGTNAGYLTA
jgi:hypothetical protein